MCVCICTCIHSEKHTHTHTHTYYIYISFQIHRLSNFEQYQLPPPTLVLCDTALCVWGRSKGCFSLFMIVVVFFSVVVFYKYICMYIYTYIYVYIHIYIYDVHKYIYVCPRFVLCDTALCVWGLFKGATHFITLQHTATYCNKLQHPSTHCTTH